MREHKTFADVGIEIPHGRSGEIDTTCPECSGGRRKSREKCLSVNIDAGTWFCHHCGWSGGLGLDGDRLKWTAPPKTYDRPAPLPAEPDPLPAKVVAWFEGRGIPRWVLEENGITAGPEFSPSQRKHVTTIRFPYYRDGELINIKYRAAPKDFWMAKGAERILYGLDGIVGAKTICIVEGEMDKLAIDSVQAWPTVSVPDGAPSPTATNYASKFSFLDGAVDRFKAAERIVLAVDMDEPGQKLADELARRLGPGKCARVTWPEGCKDANDTLLAHGAEGLMQTLADAQPYPVKGIFSVRTLAPDIERLYREGYDRGRTVGWPAFDRHYRTRPGVLTVVTGIPGNGKSQFLDNLMVRLASGHQWRFGICSPENQPLHRHASKLMAIYAGKPFDDGPTPRMTEEEAITARHWLERYFTFVLPEEPTVDAILDLGLTMVQQTGINGLVVDPWNELEHARPAGMNESEYVSQVLTRLRNFGRTHGVAIWLVAHPTKLRRDDKTATIPAPTPYDISGSAHFYNKADFCLTIHRDKNDESKPTEALIQKVRFQELGQVGGVDFRYDKATGIFREDGHTDARNAWAAD